ncbi:hypothetical protein, partial [Pseudoponticoccus marisrubri]|uniref:hypothetical protein n=1 Tax=Pseudoponticoccus marisrubri TaxID=1685382 RepID=UPI001969EC1E
MTECKIVLVTAEPKFGARWVSELGLVAESDHDSPVRLSFSHTGLGELEDFLGRGETQIVALDDGVLGAETLTEA